MPLPVFSARDGVTCAVDFAALAGAPPTVNQKMSCGNAIVTCRRDAIIRSSMTSAPRLDGSPFLSSRAIHRTSASHQLYMPDRPSVEDYASVSPGGVTPHSHSF